MPGQQESRLIQALTGAQPGRISNGAEEWSSCAALLRVVADSLSSASMPIPDGEAGARTAQAMNDAFKRAAMAMGERADRMTDGQAALNRAAVAIESAKAAHAELGPERSAPTYTPHEDPGSPAGIKAHHDHLGKMADHQAEQERRERISRQQADHLDQVFTGSSRTMKEIHGEPDPPPPPHRRTGDEAGADGSGYTPGRGGTPYSPDGPRTPGLLAGLEPPSTGVDGRPGSYDPGTGGEPYLPTPGAGGAQGGTTVAHPAVPGGAGGALIGPAGGGGLSSTTGLGLAGTAAGGIGGSLLGAGLAVGGIRGGVTPIVTNPGTSAGGVRGLGSTARAGVSGSLGRTGGAVGAASSGTASRGSTARTAGAAAGRGTAAGRSAAGGSVSGSSAGTRGAAGGRVAPAGSTVGGRAGRSKEEEKGRTRDLFDAAEDWIDDEDAAPGILH